MHCNVMNSALHLKSTIKSRLYLENEGSDYCEVEDYLPELSWDLQDREVEG